MRHTDIEQDLIDTPALLDGDQIPALTPVDPPLRAKTGARAPALKALLRKQIIPLVLMAVIGGLLWDNVAALDLAAIKAAAAQITARQWALAVVFACISFWAVGRYDGVLHAQLDTGISQRAARRTGIAAIGLSQFLGFGALTGSLIRWRLLPELSLWQSVRLSGAIALSFLAGWAVVAALAVLVFQPPLPWMKTLAALAVGLAVAMAALSIYPPRPLVRWPWPSLRTMGTVIGLAAVDTVAAGATFFVLFAPDLGVEAAQAISAYLFALGAGLIGTTPGGVGPFEATLINLLPDVPVTNLLASVLAFRIVYYAIPAALAALVVLIGPRRCNLVQGPTLTRTTASPYLPPAVEKQLFFAPRAEANLLRTRDFSLLTAADGTALGLAAPVGQSLVMISDPLGHRDCPDDARAALSKAARARYRMPAIYKCGRRMAAAARRGGWSVLPTAQEAHLVPADFTLEGAKRRQLRRMLRKAEDAGIRVQEAEATLPLDAMDAVAAAWKAARGGERGFSMGTYTRDYVACQRVFLAYQDSALVGFVTFHETRNEMTLDLMRVPDTAADGTAQALIVAAIEAARAYGCPRLSLASVPWDGAESHPAMARLRARIKRKSGAQGLKRFKAAFDPTWETLYFAAPNRLALAVAAMDVLRRITAPPATPDTNPMRAHRFATHPVWRAFKRRKNQRNS